MVSPNMLKRVFKLTLGFLSLLFVLFLFGIIITWAPDKTVAELQPKWAPLPSVFVDTMGMKVHLRDEGPRTDPNPIVLIHGTASSLHTWDGWVEELKSTRRVVRFDLPGFGLTGPSPNGDYSMDLYVKFVISILDKLEIKHAVIAGNSLGGNITWFTALNHPKYFEKLILVDASGYHFQSTSVPIGFRIARIPLLRNLVSNVLPRFIISSSVKNTYGDPSKVTETQIDRYYDLTLREGNRKALVQRFQQMTPGMHEDKIRELHIPTLILWGGKDRLIPPEYAEKFHEDIQGSKLVVFENLGHIPQEESPKETLQVFQEFMK
ncbi:alpha/beta fold hydrolase [Leptospira fletcheri]|nr:alpha/beta hydrolase [Leptospira fletcheri]